MWEACKLSNNKYLSIIQIIIQPYRASNRFFTFLFMEENQHYVVALGIEGSANKVMV